MVNVYELKKIEREAMEELITEISKINCTGHKSLSKNVCFFTVSFSEIVENNHILSPDYYDTDKMLSTICNKIREKTSIWSALNFLDNITKTKKVDGRICKKEIIESIHNLLIKSKYYE